MDSLALNAKQQQYYKHHQGLIGRARRQYGRSDPDDIQQAARTALASAARNYDPKRNVPFGAYAWRCIQNACVDLLRKDKHPAPSTDDVVGHDEDGDPLTLGEKIENSHAFDDDGDDHYDPRMQVIYDLMFEFDGLTDIERRALLLRFYYDPDEKMQIVEIARRLRRSKSDIQRSLESGIAKLQEEITKKPGKNGPL